MPNHYGHAILAIPDPLRGEEDDDLAARLAAWLAVDPCERVRPMPAELRSMCAPMTDASRAIDWAERAWGTKWGFYELQRPVRVPGDAHAVLITGCTAWGPPKDDVRDLIAAEIVRLGALRVRWTGINSHDDTFVHLGEWRRVEGSMGVIVRVA